MWLPTDHRGLQVHHEGPGDHVPVLHFVEEGAVAVVRYDLALVLQAPVGLYPVLQTVQLPRGVPDLDAGLADVDGNTFPLQLKRVGCGDGDVTYHSGASSKI